MGKLAGAGVVMLGTLIGWHLFIWNKLPSSANMSVNPITDVAHVRILGASQLGFTDPQAIAAFNGARDLVGGTIGERQLASLAREYFDVYAMILPYHVIISDAKPLQPLTSSNASSLAHPAARAGEYVNERFGFRFSYPRGFTAGASPEDGDGVQLTSKDGGLSYGRGDQIRPAPNFRSTTTATSER